VASIVPFLYNGRAERSGLAKSRLILRTSEQPASFCPRLGHVSGFENASRKCADDFGGADVAFLGALSVAAQ
jgi:hypothetical protein